MARKLTEQGYLAICEVLPKFMRTKDLLALEYLRGNPTKAVRASIPGPKKSNRTPGRRGLLLLNDNSKGTIQLGPTKARARQFSKDLSPRQREIVQMFGEGRSMKVIADLLKLSEKTVEFHKHRIMECFNLKSNADLVLFALKHQLISVPPEPYEQVRTQRPVA